MLKVLMPNLPTVIHRQREIFQTLFESTCEREKTKFLIVPFQDHLTQLFSCTSYLVHNALSKNLFGYTGLCF